MFVSSSTHRRLISYTGELAFKFQNLQIKYNNLLSEWNSLIRRINNHGGEALFSRSQRSTTQFNADEIRALIQLVHPDKHQGKESAVRMTQKLIKMKDSL